MSIISAKGGASAGYQIGHSLRLRAGASASLSTTSFTSGGTPNKITFSTWLKRGSLGYQGLVSTYSDANNIAAFYINGNNRIQFYNWQVGAYTVNKESVAVFRDMSAHYHFVLIIDTTLATAEDRFQIWVNGVRITSWTTNTNTHSQNAGVILGYAAGGVTQRIGVNPDGTTFNDAYFSDVHYLWGNKAGASDFGQLDENGVWVPKKPVGITYGTYGAHLDFSNGSSTTTLGYDKNGVNNWTCNNVSLTAGVTYDWMEDTPTNNYCTLNPLDNNGCSNTAANLQVGSSTSGNSQRATVAFDISTANFYAEFLVSSTGYTAVGIAVQNPGNFSNSNFRMWYRDGTKFNGSTWVAYSSAYTTELIQIAVKNGSIWFGKGGSWVGDPVAETGAAFTGLTGIWSFAFQNQGAGTSGGDFNFGQRPFAYTPPTGFKALCTSNLPAVSIPDPEKHFDVVLNIGANIKASAEAVFTSFMEWIKDRANVNNHQLIDSVRGTSAVLQSNTTAAETTYSSPSGNSVGWVWKANGTGVSNTDGSITSTVGANQTAGFSIVTYSGTGVAGSVGHGLGIAPKLIIWKNRSKAALNWVVWHAEIYNYYLVLNTTNAKGANSNVFSSYPNASLIYPSTAAGVNESGANIIAYCFAEIPGYSKFGSYTGNGSDDGPFVWCGFRPRYLMVKRADSTSNWEVVDTSRDTFNNAYNDLAANLSNAENVDGQAYDILCNGFKLRNWNVTGGKNTSGGTYIFAAFAEHPFGGSNVSPAPAR